MCCYTDINTNTVIILKQTKLHYNKIQLTYIIISLIFVGHLFIIARPYFENFSYNNVNIFLKVHFCSN